MKNIKFIGKKIYSNVLFKIFVIILVILCSGHAYQTFFAQSYYIPVLILLLFSHPVLHNFFKNKLDIGGIGILVFMFMNVITLISNFFDGTVNYIVFMATILSAYGITRIYKFQDLVKFYKNFILVIALISLGCYFLLNFTNLLDSLPIFSNINDLEYLSSPFFNSIKIIVNRNCGMFWEPGLFATYLIIGILFEILFCNNKPNLYRIGILSITLITTFSTAGYVLLFLCFLLYLSRFIKPVRYTDSNFKIFCNKFLPYIGITLVLVIIFNFSNIVEIFSLSNSESIAKLLPQNFRNTERILAVEHNMKLFYDNPLFGVGFENAFILAQNHCDTSTTTYLPSIFGVLGFLYTFLWLHIIFKNNNLNKFSRIILALIVLSILNKEPHHMLMFTWCLLFWLIGFSKSNEKGSIY